MQEAGDSARERLEFALHNTDKPEDWDNKLLDRAAACDLVEHCCLTARQTGKFELALQMVEWYKRIGAPGRALIMGGDIATDWARARQEALKNSSIRRPRKRRRCANCSSRRPRLTNTRPSRQPRAGTRRLARLAASRAIDAGDQVKAQPLLDEMFELKPRPDARAEREGWYQLGESFRKEIPAPNTARQRRPRKGPRKPRIFRASVLRKRPSRPTRPASQIAHLPAVQEIAQGQHRQGRQRAGADFGLSGSRRGKRDQQRARFTLVDICYGAKKYKTVVQKMHGEAAGPCCR